MPPSQTGNCISLAGTAQSVEQLKNSASLLFTASKPALGLNGSGRLYHWRVRWLGQETNHSAPCSTEINNSWIYTSTPSYGFMSCLIKKGDIPFNFILHTSAARGWRRAEWVLTAVKRQQINHSRCCWIYSLRNTGPTDVCAIWKTHPI